MPENAIQHSHIYSTYFAPRGRSRIFNLGIQLAQLYLSPFDQIIGVIGEAGSGKSVLIKGMFPGLELTNDDDGVNVRPLPILDQDAETGFFSPHTYHMDIRFEMGFHQLSELADAIRLAVRRGKRVVIEHFDLIYPLLGANANLLIGVGEEIIITRPTIFGPEPQEVYQRAYDSLPYRLMAHTAEDLCECFLPPKELELLYFLASSPNQVFTREQLLDHIWGYEYIGDTRTVDVHIKRLREKIRDDENWALSTVWGIGYKFEVRR